MQAAIRAHNDTLMQEDGADSSSTAKYTNGAFSALLLQGIAVISEKIARTLLERDLTQVCIPYAAKVLLHMLHRCFVSVLWTPLPPPLLAQGFCTPPILFSARGVAASVLPSSHAPPSSSPSSLYPRPSPRPNPSHLPLNPPPTRPACIMPFRS